MASRRGFFLAIAVAAVALLALTVTVTVSVSAAGCSPSACDAPFKECLRHCDQLDSLCIQKCTAVSNQCLSDHGRPDSSACLTCKRGCALTDGGSNYSFCISGCSVSCLVCLDDLQNCIRAGGDPDVCWDRRLPGCEQCDQTESTLTVMTVGQLPRDCVKACKSKGKDDANACKHVKFTQRADCYKRAGQTQQSCETTCTRKPHTAAAIESPSSLGATVEVSTIVGAPTFALAESEYQSHFTSFVQKHGKKYTRDEFFPRYSIFKANLNKIHAHNAKQLPYTMAVNEFADLTPEEFRSKMTGYKRGPQTPDLLRSSEGPHLNMSLAGSIDWRQRGAVTGAKNQGGCGSCWSFSTTGAVEGAYAIRTGRLVSLSEQQLIDCSSAYGTHGCRGGQMDNAFRYIIGNGGLTAETAYPYSAAQGYCWSGMQAAAKITNFVDVQSDSEAALMQAVNYGPVSAAIEADPDLFTFYSGGVLTSPQCGTNVDHAVLVVGYGTDRVGGDYWIVKNSWGESWGENGFVRLARGRNQCGILSQPSYPVV